MPKIKNINPLQGALNVAGAIVEFGDVIDVDKEAAESLIASPNFEKASLADTRASAKDENSGRAKKAEPKEPKSV